MIIALPTMWQAPIARALARKVRSDMLMPRPSRIAHHSAGVLPLSSMMDPIAVIPRPRREWIGRPEYARR